MDFCICRANRCLSLLTGQAPGTFQCGMELLDRIILTSIRIGTKIGIRTQLPNYNLEVNGGFNASALNVEMRVENGSVKVLI